MWESWNSPPHRKEVESPDKVTQNILAYMRIEPRQIPILAVLVQRLGDIRRPYTTCPTVSFHESYVNLLSSRKKALPLIASLSVLSIKFHYIQLIRNGSLLLVRGKHSSLDNFSSHHSIKFFKLNAFIRVFIDTGLFINFTLV